MSTPANATVPGDGGDFGARLAADWAGSETGNTRDGTPWVRVAKERVLEFVTWLHGQGYGRFLDCTVVDDPQREDRFEVNWLFYCMDTRRWLRVKSRTAERMPSIVSVFAGANWYEREAFDLFGVRFDGHPELTRILLPDDFQGHALRRDHPLGGEPVDFTVTRELYGTGSASEPSKKRGGT